MSYSQDPDIQFAPIWNSQQPFELVHACEEKDLATPLAFLEQEPERKAKLQLDGKMQQSSELEPEICARLCLKQALRPDSRLVFFFRHAGDSELCRVEVRQWALKKPGKAFKFPFFGTKIFIPIISNIFGRVIFCSAVNPS